jgi:hypothetical protein
MDGYWILQNWDGLIFYFLYLSKKLKVSTSHIPVDRRNARCIASVFFSFLYRVDKAAQQDTGFHHFCQKAHAPSLFLSLLFSCKCVSSGSFFQIFSNRKWK